MPTMPIEVVAGTPLANALAGVIQPKLRDCGLSSGSDDAAMSEYIVLMLVNGKTREQIAGELSGELLGLPTDDPTVAEFTHWLFVTLNQLAADDQQQQRTGDQARMSNSAGVGSFDTGADAGAGAGQDQDRDPDANHIDLDTDMTTPTTESAPEPVVPTGPKSMRNGSIGSVSRGGSGSGRPKQFHHHTAAGIPLSRPADLALHRIRGQTGSERISRTPPIGPRGQGRTPRMPNGLMAGRPGIMQSGLAGMGVGSGPVPMPGPGPVLSPGMNGINGVNGINGINGANGSIGLNGMPVDWQAVPSPDIYVMLEQQSKMMQMISSQMINGYAQGGGPGSGPSPGPGNRRLGRGGRSLFDRADPSRAPFRRGGASSSMGEPHGPGVTQGLARAARATTESRVGSDDGEDTDMGQTLAAAQAWRDAPNPDEAVCRWNQRCTNKDCSYAHASPAAPFGVTVDVNDVCTFGAACKNKKCVARHPSPAAKLAHQSEQDCKFFPSCHNPACTFRHPTMPPCRNGGNCSTPGCRFTHIKRPCRFNPCLNQTCPFMHGEGQRGVFKDKVWTAEQMEEGGSGHPSERRFVGSEEEQHIIVGGSAITKDEDLGPVVA